eukprot:152773-Prorocentrum_minimum.AAC.3
MPRAEWYTSVDSRRLSTVELKSNAFLAVDSGACRRWTDCRETHETVRTACLHDIIQRFLNFAKHHVRNRSSA